MGLFIGLQRQHQKSQEKMAVLKNTQNFRSLPSTDKATVYGPAQHPSTHAVMEQLRIHGISPELIPINSGAELGRISELPKMISRGLASETSVSLPIVGINGEGFNGESLQRIFAELAIKDPHPGQKGPFITLYGVSNCSFTAAARQELTQSGQPFEYIDMNSSAVLAGRAFARLKASGGDDSSVAMPLIEINGYVRSRMPISEALKRYKDQ